MKKAKSYFHVQFCAFGHSRPRIPHLMAIPPIKTVTTEFEQHLARRLILAFITPPCMPNSKNTD